MIIREFTDEIDELIQFLTSQTWTFLSDPNPIQENIKRKYEENHYSGTGNMSFWIIDLDDRKVGFIRIYDIDDGTPLIDLRILRIFAGKGIGTKALEWIGNYLFERFSDIDRIEGNTRQDNYAMRTVFEKCGFVKEAHYRKAWKDNDGKKYDAVGYALLREDWSEKKKTPVIWDDFRKDE